MSDDAIQMPEAAKPLHETDLATTYICDAAFMADLNKLKELRSFLMQEVAVTNLDALSFGALNSLRFHSNGREPTDKEWSQVEYCTRVLFSQLSEPLKQKLRFGNIPWPIALLPLPLIGIALASLVLATITFDRILATGSSAGIGGNAFPFYLMWVVSLGAIGALAFIGMNALSVQSDVTFDITNQRLMILRVVIGGLFGLVLSLPFGFKPFLDFCYSIVKPGQENDSLTWQAITLVMPFILGFSTSLVILILNQLVEAIQAFFGRRPSEVLRSGERTPETTAVKG